VTTSWTCHICGKERPDANISVHTNDTSEEHNLPKGTMKQNVRYCNDNHECISQVSDFRFDKKKGI
jgi:hypothetical protein